MNNSLIVFSFLPGKTSRKEDPCIDDHNCAIYAKCNKYSGCACRDELTGDGENCKARKKLFNVIIYKISYIYRYSTMHVFQLTWLSTIKEELCTVHISRGGSRIFLRRGCTYRICLRTGCTYIYFFCRTPVVLESRPVISVGGGGGGGGGWGAHPQHPAPRSAPA